MTKFRFQDLDIWKEAIDIGNLLFDIADKLEEKKLFRFAEQLEAGCPFKQYSRRQWIEFKKEISSISKYCKEIDIRKCQH
jgi:hypothetical protein